MQMIRMRQLMLRRWRRRALVHFGALTVALMVMLVVAARTTMMAALQKRCARSDEQHCSLSNHQ